MAIHNAAEDIEYAQKQARKVLAFKRAPLVLAIDQTRNRQHDRGMTAYRCGLQGHPGFIVIDRAGKISFRSDTATGTRNLSGIFSQIVQNPQKMTEHKANELTERTLAEEIENA